MMTYVLLVSWQRDSGDCGNEVKVFSTFEKATDALLDEMNAARVDFSDIHETEEDNYHEGDMSWSIWEKEEYCFNHCDIIIFEREVE